MAIKLTDKHLKTLPPGEGGKTKDYSDELAKGLVLRVSPTSRRFLFAYRKPGKKTPAKYPIGKIGEHVNVTEIVEVRKGVNEQVTITKPLTLALARREAGRLRSMVVNDKIDPLEEKRKRDAQVKAEAAKTEAEEKGQRFRDIIIAFEVEEVAAMRPATREGWRGYLRREIVPALGDFKPEELTAEAIAELRAKIEERGAVVAAARCFEVVRRVINWACSVDATVAIKRRRHGIDRMKTNPALAAAPYHKAPKRPKPAAFTNREIRDLIIAAREHDGAFLELIAHTATRSGETRAARWADIDFENKTWSIPPQAAKTGDQHGEAHLVPLSPQVVKLLEGIRERNARMGVADSPWVFPGQEGGHLQRPTRVERQVKAAAKVTGHGIVHRWRRTVATRMHEHGVDGRAIELSLGHAIGGGMMALYSSAEMMPQRREALTWWSHELSRIVAGMEVVGNTEDAQADTSSA